MNEQQFNEAAAAILKEVARLITGIEDGLETSRKTGRPFTSEKIKSIWEVIQAVRGRIVEHEQKAQPGWLSDEWIKQAAKIEEWERIYAGFVALTRDAVAKITNVDLEAMLLPVLKKLVAAAGIAAKAQNKQARGAIQAAAKSYQALLSQWNDAAGERTHANIKALEDAFGDLADDIAAALRGDLPGQGEGEEWKR